jgi:Lipocalin-like domain
MNEARHTPEGLFGAWRLLSLDAIKADGEATTGWLGRKPTGLLVYDRSGYMSVQIMRGPRGLSVEQDEKSASAPAYYAYFGAFEVDDRTHTIAHIVLGSLRSEEVGVTYTQDFELSPDQLTLLTARHLVDGEERRNRIVWQRGLQRAF